MTPSIESILLKLRDELVAASTEDIARVIEEARCEALAEFKQLLKARLLEGIFEHATEQFSAPVRPAGMPPEVVAAETAAGDGALAEPAARPATIADHAPAQPVLDATPAMEPMPAAEPAAAMGTTPAPQPAPAAAADDTLFEPVQPDDLLLEGEGIDSEILEEIEAIRQQISKNEQLLSQLKPFYSGREGGHA